MKLLVFTDCDDGSLHVYRLPLALSPEQSRALWEAIHDTVHNGASLALFDPEQIAPPLPGLTYDIGDKLVCLTHFVPELFDPEQIAQAVHAAVLNVLNAPQKGE